MYYLSTSWEKDGLDDDVNKTFIKKAAAQETDLVKLGGHMSRHNRCAAFMGKIFQKFAIRL